MKVLSINADHKRCQMIGADGPSWVYDTLPTGVGQPRVERWEQPTFSVDDPGKVRGEFLLLALACMVTTREVTQALGACVASDVQVLPVTLADTEQAYCVWNTTNFVDALDTTRTQFKPPPFSSTPSRWVFDARVLVRPMLFRLPQNPATLLTVSECGDPAADFYRCYRRLRMRGLKFELLWSSEDDRA